MVVFSATHGSVVIGRNPSQSSTFHIENENASIQFHQSGVYFGSQGQLKRFVYGSLIIELIKHDQAILLMDFLINCIRKNSRFSIYTDSGLNLGSNPYVAIVNCSLQDNESLAGNIFPRAGRIKWDARIDYVSPYASVLSSGTGTIR